MSRAAREGGKYLELEVEVRDSLQAFHQHFDVCFRARRPQQKLRPDSKCNPNSMPNAFDHMPEMG